MIAVQIGPLMNVRIMKSVWMLTFLAVWCVECMVSWNEQCSFIKLRILIVIPRKRLSSRCCTGKWLLVKCSLCWFVKRTLRAFCAFVGRCHTCQLRRWARWRPESWDRKDVFYFPLDGIAYCTTIARVHVCVFEHPRATQPVSIFATAQITCVTTRNRTKNQERHPSTSKC